MVNGVAAGAARQSLSNMLFLAATVSEVPLGAQVGFGLGAANEPRPATASHDIVATAGRRMAPTAARVLIAGLAGPGGLGRHGLEERLMGGEPGGGVFGDRAGPEQRLAEVLGI